MSDKPAHETMPEVYYEPVNGRKPKPDEKVVLCFQRTSTIPARGFFGVPNSEWNYDMDAAPKDGTRILGYRFHEGHHKDEAESFHVVWWQKDCFDYEGFMDYEQRRWNIRAWQPLKHAKKAAPKKEGGVNEREC